MRRNILLILTDQQRADTIGKYGNSLIMTPSLDELCGRGVRFERAYCEMPECCPARALIFSGEWGHVTGNMGNGFVSPLKRTFAHDLAETGYHTHYIGKLHSHPYENHWGFKRIERSEGVGKPETDDFLKFVSQKGYDWLREPNGVRSEYYYLPQVSQVADEHHVTSWTGDRAVDFIQNAPRKQNWLLTVSFLKPHPPFDVTTPYLHMYDPDTLPLPVRTGADRTAMWPLHTAQNHSKWIDDAADDLTRMTKAAYYASISHVDCQVGRILQALDAAGHAQDTLVVFTSDHGEMLGDHYQWGKRSFYNGAAKIPMVISCPGLLPDGDVCTEIVGHRDIAPTVLRAAGLTPPSRPWGGEDLVERAHGVLPRREMSFGELTTNVYDKMSPVEAIDLSSLYMCVTEDWKYIYSPNGGREALFNLVEDRDELNNLAGEAGAETERKRLRSAMVAFYRSEGYSAALDSSLTDLRSVPLAPVPFPRNRQGVDLYGLVRR